MESQDRDMCKVCCFSIYSNDFKNNQDKSTSYLLLILFSPLILDFDRIGLETATGNDPVCTAIFLA